MKTFKINELAEIYSGYQVRDKSELGKEGNISFIQVKDIDRVVNKVSLENLEKISMEKDMGKYQVKKDDVLFLAKGNILASLIEEDSFKNDQVYVPMSHFFILRPKKEIALKGYIWWMLNHKDTQLKLKRLLKGTMMAFISRPDFENLEIPVPSLEKQKIIVGLVELREKEKLLIQKIEQEKDKFLDKALSELLVGKIKVDSFDFMEELKKL